MTWYCIRELQRLHQKLPELINKFSKVSGHKINIQKPVTFLYTKNELSKRESKKTILFTITSKNIKYQRVNLAKDTKDMCMEYYKTLKKKNRRR